MIDFSIAQKKLETFPKFSTVKASFDFETTGLHLHHDSQPFMLCATLSTGQSFIWEAEVDPLTRQCYWSKADQQEIFNFFHNDTWTYIASNSKFDVRCLTKIIEVDPVEFLTRCHDTIFEHHSFNSGEKHGIKQAALLYCGLLDDDEKDLKRAVKQARVIAKQLGWKIASKDNCPYQHRAPSKAQGGWAVMDMWLPKALAKFNWENSIAYSRLSKAYKLALSVWHPSPEVPELSLAAFLKKDQIIATEVANLSGWEWAPPSIHPFPHTWWTVCSKYCTLDTVRSLILHEKLVLSLQQQKTIGFVDGRPKTLHDCYLENRLALPVSFATEQKGLGINLAKCKELTDKFTLDRENASLACQAAADLPFNLGSSKVVQNLLYKYFGYPVLKRTKSGNPATDGEALSAIVKVCQEEIRIKEGTENIETAISQYFPPLWQREAETLFAYKQRLKTWFGILVAEEKPSIPQLFAFASSLLMFKKANTSLTYLKSYQRLAHRFDDTFGILYPSLNPIGTKTTRYSSSNPNGQNISKGGKGKKGLEWMFKTNHSLRSLFGPLPGQEWWSFDYKQIQLVIFAILSGDQKMIAAVHRGEDFHTFVAKEIFEISDADWTILSPEKISYYRDIAKTVNFAFIFGAKEDKLNRTSGIPGLYDILGNVFPAAIDFLERTERYVANNGFVTTPGGYRLYVPSTTPYAGVNYMVQGCEGEIMKRAQSAIHCYLESRAPKAYMALYVHDDTIISCPHRYGADHAGPILRILNDAALSYGIPSTAECKYITTNWAEGLKIAV